MYLCDDTYFKYRTISEWSLHFSNEPYLESSDFVCWPLSTEGLSLFREWYHTPTREDPAISGILADWLDDHRDHLLTGATGPDPASRLDLLIHWLREVRCFGRENVPA